jgi:hypothetical protein
VLNYKDREAPPESFEQFNALLSKLGAERKLDPQLFDQLVVLPVNADSAFRGRTENKPKLLAQFGLPCFARRV